MALCLVSKLSKSDVFIYDLVKLVLHDNVIPHCLSGYRPTTNYMTELYDLMREISRKSRFFTKTDSQTLGYHYTLLKL